MAGVIKGRNPGEWRAYYWDKRAGRQVWIPTDVTKTWDGFSIDMAEEARARWLADSGISRVRSSRRALQRDDPLSGYIHGFLEQHAALRQAQEATRQTLGHHVRCYAVDFFVATHGLKDVRQWWRQSAHFSTWLRVTHPHQSILTAKKICQSLRRFGEYLATHHIIHQPWLIPLPQVRQKPVTPLVRAVGPAEIIELSERLPTPWGMFVLLGFFASLRPEEIYGLTREDFITGERAKKDTVTHARLVKLGLGSGLSVSVSKTRTRAALRDLPKTHYSYGTVNVWSLEAAKTLAGMLRGLDFGPLFGDVDRVRLDKEYRAVVKAVSGLSAQDLRRASGLYLGREVGLDPFLLQDHFRHSSMATTLLYTRRPTDEKETADTQNFDDVG